MLEKLLPAIVWLKTYQRKDLWPDIIAGLVVAIMLVPQVMAYAMLAGLPPVMGLYASTVPLFVYAVFGSSRQLAIGPSAIVSILTLSSISALAPVGTQEYIALAILLALMVGVIQSILGLLRAGFITNFLSHAVISGFTSAAAVVITLSQLKHILGLELEPSNSIFELFIGLFQGISETNLITLILGLSSIFVLILFKLLLPRVPAAVFVVVGSSLAVYFFNLDTMGVKIVAEVPKGLPSFIIPSMHFETIKALVPAALTISFVSFIESIAVASTFAAKDKYKIDANKELIGLGFANVLGAFFQAFPITGSFGRSAVNYQSGAKTQVAAIVTALIIVATLLFLTPLFYFLPKSALSAIVIVAVAGLIDFKALKHLWNIRRIDSLSLIIAFLATLFIGVEQGIIIGVVFSLMLFIRRSAYPHTAELGYLRHSDIFRDVERNSGIQTFENIIIIRIDASLYFANMAFVEDLLDHVVVDRPNIKHIILDFSSVNDMDAIALFSLEEITRELRVHEISLHIAGMKGPVRDLVNKANWSQKYGSNIEHLSLQQALSEILGEDALFTMQVD